jgi:hypothetical protein
MKSDLLVARDARPFEQAAVERMCAEHAVERRAQPPVADRRQRGVVGSKQRVVVRHVGGLKARASDYAILI